MTDAKAFVDSAVAIYCSDPAGFGAQIDDLLSRFYEEDEKDQDRIVAEVSKRIRAGDEVATTIRELVTERLISAVGELSPEQQKETVHSVLQIARRAKLKARLAPPEADGVVPP